MREVQIVPGRPVQKHRLRGLQQLHQVGLPHRSLGCCCASCPRADHFRALSACRISEWYAECSDKPCERRGGAPKLQIYLCQCFDPCSVLPFALCPALRCSVPSHAPLPPFLYRHRKERQQRRRRLLGLLHGLLGRHLLRAMQVCTRPLAPRAAFWRKLMCLLPRSIAR